MAKATPKNSKPKSLAPLPKVPTTGTDRPDFTLKSEEVTPDMLLAAAAKASDKAKKPAKAKAAPQAAATDEPQVLAYRHADRRKNNPEVGLVNEASDPEQAKTPWAYDPHLDPALQFDSARAGAEKLIEDALAGDDPAAMRHALEELRRMSAVSKRHVAQQNAIKKEAAHAHSTGSPGLDLGFCQKGLENAESVLNHSKGFQPGLFEAPFESMPLRSAMGIYKHDRGGANRTASKGCPAFKRNCIELSESVMNSKIKGRQL